MSGALELYLILLLAGLVLLAVEIFVPGGVIGGFGAVAILGALVTGFFAFGTQGGLVSALCILVFGTIALMLWMRVFPGTAVGRQISLPADGKLNKAATDEAKALLGKEGVAHSELRPAGIALIDGRRVDVVADASYIQRGARIVVAEVEGNRIVVRPVVAS